MPKVLEFHFNPRLKPDLIFDSFCYEPENIYEKRMGNLYMVGLLKNVLPQNLHFLDKLAKIIQKEYYRSIVRKPEKTLKESLKEANEFLEQTAKKGDVSWLGNLSFAVLALIPQPKFLGVELNFTKVGDLKIFLLRDEKIIDIDQKLKFEEITPWPLKIFSNIVSGKLAENDLLLVLTKEVADFFERENLLPEIGKIPHQIFAKKIKEIFDKKKEEILKISGISLFIILTKEVLAGKKEIILPKPYPKEFNLKQVFSPFINIFKGLIEKPRFFLSGFVDKIKFKKLPKLAIPKLNKKLILILALIFFLALGFFVSQSQEKEKLKEGQITLEKIQEKVNQAESFLILKTPEAEKKANLLLKESFEEISQLAKIVSKLPKDFQSQVFSLKENISKTLFELNKLEMIEEPKLFFEFDAQKFVPQKMILSNSQLYFFSPYLENLFRVDKNVQAEIIEINQKFNLATLFDEVVLFFSKPNQLTILKEGQFSQFNLQEPYSDFNFDDFICFRGNLYFLDSKPATLQGSQIIKYPYWGNLKWGPGQLWLEKKEEKVLKARSLAIDGSIWLLDKDSICRYYTGRLQEKIILEIFPKPKEFKKIFTSTTLPYLYLLEPAQKRIIILDKKGQIIKQFQSQKFDHLLDFAISQDGKAIYLLNGLKVYQINF
jgi:hypothetical protein